MIYTEANVTNLEIFRIDRKFKKYKDQILEIDRHIELMLSQVKLLKAKKIGLSQALSKLEENIIKEIVGK